MTDKYDQAVAYLTENPEYIPANWVKPSRPYHYLFAVVHPSRQLWMEREDGQLCGCLTQIRGNPHEYVAWTDELTNAIRADERLPCSENDIKPEHLPVFAEWQRRIDRELNRN